MKKFKTFYMVAALLLTAVALGFSSCSDDDDEGGGSSSELVGLWESVYQHYIYKEDGRVVEDEEYDDADTRLRFNADGTCEGAEYYSNKWYWDNYGTWTYKNGVLTIYDADEDEYESGSVKALTSSKLVLESTYTYTDNGIKCEDYSYIEYKKINE